MCSLGFSNCGVFLILMFCMTQSGGQSERFTADHDIPPVVNATWDAVIPKFNSLIIRRVGNINAPICSGALISYSFVLTVGLNCVLIAGLPISPEQLIVRLLSVTTSVIERNVKKVLSHEGCCINRNYLIFNDIALIQLTETVHEEDIIPARITRKTTLYHPHVNDLWDLSNIRDHHVAVNYRNAIWHVRTRFISGNICSKIIKPKKFNYLKLTCTSYYHRKGSNDCKTDQGSPLSYKGELIGLVVYKRHCGGNGAVALYVNIGIHSHWIRKNVQVLSKSEESV